MRTKKILAVILSVVMLFGIMMPCAFAETRAESAKLHFNKDGKFTVLNLSDSQDNQTLYLMVKRMMRASVKKYKPDLVVMTGDNIAGYSIDNQKHAKKSIKNFMQIFQQLGVPVAIVFGNHDDDSIGDIMSLEEQIEYYNTFKVNLTCDEEPSLTGCGTYSVPIYTNDGTKVALNLWMMDNRMSDELRGTNKWGYVHQDQLDWYLAKSQKLAEENGGQVPSMVFQHIPTEDTWDYITDDFELPEGSKGELNETISCSYADDQPEVRVMKANGDVMAIVSGHNHTNTFDMPIGGGMRLIATPSCGYDSYGSKDTYGGRVFVFDQNDVRNYETFTFKTEDLAKDNFIDGIILQLTYAWQDFMNWFDEFRANIGVKYKFK